MKKVCYVVECNSGQYDDYHWWIAGIFEDAFAAEKLKQEILKEIEIIRNTEAPYEFENIEELTDEQYDIYYKWRQETNQADEFNEATVVEYPLGEKVNFGEK